MQTFPAVIIAGMYIFREAAFFELENKEELKLIEVDIGGVR